METLYPPGKNSIPPWTAPSTAEVTQTKVNDLYLPEGHKP